MKRCGNEYEATKANLDYVNNSKNKGRKSKLNENVKEFIKEKLEVTWSPKQIIGRYFQGTLCFKTIYNWIYKGVLDISLQVLRRKGKPLKTKETRGTFNVGTFLISKGTKIVLNLDIGNLIPSCHLEVKVKDVWRYLKK